jgi:hypothetical protein
MDTPSRPLLAAGRSYNDGPMSSRLIGRAPSAMAFSLLRMCQDAYCPRAPAAGSRSAGGVAAGGSQGRRLCAVQVLAPTTTRDQRPLRGQ